MANENDKLGSDNYKPSTFFVVYFVLMILSFLITFILAIIFSNPESIITYNPPVNQTDYLRITLIGLPTLFTVFLLFPIFLRKYLRNKNNVVLFLLGMVAFFCLALILAIILEFFDYGSSLLVDFGNQMIFNAILGSVYCYFMFDMEIFHKGFSEIHWVAKLLSILGVILPSSAIIFRVLDLNIYTQAIESSFLASTVFIAFYTLIDIIIQAFKSSRRINDKVYKTAYYFIGFSSILLFTFFIIYAAVVVGELYQLSLLADGSLLLLTFVMIFLYMGYVWPMRHKE